MLATVSAVWWPKLHREVLLIAKACQQCTQSGKNIKPLLRQNQFGKLPEAQEVNEEIAIDFAGPFVNAKNRKRYLLVSIDHFSDWPDAMFLNKPNTNKVLSFLKQYIALHGIPHKIRTDPGSVFRSAKFKNFCKNRLIEHIECPVSDHRGNGKVERLIRTINERLRTDPKIVLHRGNSGLAAILFALRMNPSPNKKSAYERHFGKPPNTITSMLSKTKRNVLASTSNLQLPYEDIESGQDSTILVRERTRGTKLEAAYAKKRGSILKQSEHTVTFLPAGQKAAKVLSKRDVAKPPPSTNRDTNEEHVKQPNLSTPTTPKPKQQATATKDASNSDDSIIVLRTIPPNKAKDTDQPGPSSVPIPKKTSQPTEPDTKPPKPMLQLKKAINQNKISKKQIHIRSAYQPRKFYQSTPRNKTLKDDKTSVFPPLFLESDDNDDDQHHAPPITDQHIKEELLAADQFADAIQDAPANTIQSPPPTITQPTHRARY